MIVSEFFSFDFFSPWLIHIGWSRNNIYLSPRRMFSWFWIDSGFLLHNLYVCTFCLICVSPYSLLRVVQSVSRWQFFPLNVSTALIWGIFCLGPGVSDADPHPAGAGHDHFHLCHVVPRKCLWFTRGEFVEMRSKFYHLQTPQCTKLVLIFRMRNFYMVMICGLLEIIY